MKKPYLETGKIVGTHGVRGEMRLQPWTDSANDTAALKRLYLDNVGNEFLKVEKMRVHGSMIILKAEGINDIPTAEKYRNKVVFADRQEFKLSDEQYFIQDLISCKVYDADTKVFYGEISDVSATGANDVWHIKSDDKGELLIPSIPDVVIKVDVDNGEVFIRPLEGMFE